MRVNETLAYGQFRRKLRRVHVEFGCKLKCNVSGSTSNVQLIFPLPAIRETRGCAKTKKALTSEIVNLQGVFMQTSSANLT